MTETTRTNGRPAWLKTALRLLVVIGVVAFLYFGTEFFLERFDLDRLYERWGFVEVGVRDAWIASPPGIES